MSFKAHIVWIDGGAHGETIEERDLARRFLEDLERQRDSRMVKPVYLVTGMDKKTSYQEVLDNPDFKVFQRLEDGWIRDIKFEKDMLQIAEDTRKKELKEQEEKAAKLAAEIKESFDRHIKSAREAIRTPIVGHNAVFKINGKEIAVVGDISMEYKPGKGGLQGGAPLKIEDLKPPERSVTIKVNLLNSKIDTGLGREKASDADIDRLSQSMGIERKPGQKLK